jgi:hypothetical protein
MVVRGAIGISLGHMQAVWGVVDWPRPALILAVFGDEQAPYEDMVGGRKAQAERIAIAPRDGLNSRGAVFGGEARPQDGASAHAPLCGPLEGPHDRPRAGDAMLRIATGQVPIARVEKTVAEGDLLTRDIVLIGAVAVIMAHHP